MMSLFNDEPVIKDEDLFFGFKETAAKYADLFLNREFSPPFALLIDGERGSGKTTLMYAMERHIRKRTERFYNCQRECKDGEAAIRLCRTFWFYPTKYQNEDKIIAVFLYNLISQTKEHPYVKAVLKKKECKKALRSLEIKLGISVPPLFKLSLSKNSAANYDYYPEIDLFLKEAQELIYPFLQCGGTDCQNKKINKSPAFVVFIDDLDWCDENKFPQLMNRIKMLIDTMRTICFFVFGIAGDQFRRLMTQQRSITDPVVTTAYNADISKLFQGIYNMPSKRVDEFDRWARKIFKPALDGKTLSANLLDTIVHTCDNNCREAKKLVNNEIIKKTTR